jgi:hypothetical protein
LTGPERPAQTSSTTPGTLPSVKSHLTQP